MAVPVPTVLRPPLLARPRYREAAVDAVALRIRVAFALSCQSHEVRVGASRCSYSAPHGSNWLHNEKVRRAHRCPGVQLRKLNRRMNARTIVIVIKGACGAIVDDPIISIDSGSVQIESAYVEVVRSSDPFEQGIVETDP